MTKPAADADLFRRLRQLAEQSGFTALKTQAGYQLLQGKTCIAGDRHQLDLQGLARALQKLHVLGRT